LRAWSSLGGIVFSVLAVIGAVFLFDGPSDSSPAKMTAWYQSSSHRSHIHIGWVLLGVGLFCLIWFVAALRERVAAADEENGSFLGTVVAVAGTAFIGMAIAMIGLADGIKTMSDDTYQHRVYSGVIHAAGDASYVMLVTGGVAVASLIFATSAATFSVGILPRWVGWFGLFAGVCAIFSLFFFTMIVWLLWIAVASVLLYTRQRSLQQASLPGPAPAS
jgi:hypothetical protein